LFVEGLVGRARELGFALRAGEFGRVFVGFFDEFFYARAGGVVVEEFVVAFFDACGRGVRVFVGLDVEGGRGGGGGGTNIR